MPVMAVKMVMAELYITGHGPLPVKVITYFPGLLAAELISPVLLLVKISPAGLELKVPPKALFMIGEGLGPVLVTMPEG